MKNSKYSRIRETIKNLSQQQVEAKNQRKTVNLKGERTMEPSQAVSEILSNKYQLRHLFLAYNILKGKEVIYPKRAEYSTSLIEKMVDIYKPVVVEVQEEIMQAS